MNRIRESAAVWITLQFAAMTIGWWGFDLLYRIASEDAMGKSLTSSTVILSVALAIITQLWLKLNELSGLSSLVPVERQRLRVIVTFKIRAIVWLMIYLVTFIFFVLACSALTSSQEIYVRYLLTGVGAGFGAVLPMLAAALVDLNEVSAFRWTVELSDQTAKKTNQVLGELKRPDGGFENDQHLTGYRKVRGT